SYCFMVLSSPICDQFRAHRALPSFPTRRSSDLGRTPGATAGGGCSCPARAARVLRAWWSSTWSPRSALGVLSDRVDVLRRDERRDRKSTRLNSSHVKISYAVFCLKKKKNNNADI